ncbi:GDNF family receptor alpha-3 isoform X1 [Meriones unguiculatus]|uniref:GDNF family receptor alpha-3 isoform X1 n=1 Tax=Meriones unguiculatus TaxID=10047 RepID=UPI00293E67DC|nr:GDNF family receptor alpha-3 isoform X1 [Meriones unguiculatus]
MGLSRSPPPPPLVLLLVLSLWLPLGAGDFLPTENRLMNSCIQARKKCQANPACKAAYHRLASCTSGVSTPLPFEESALSPDCLEAAQQLRNSSLMGCTCHRRMKHQATCLNIYWTVHPARSLEYFQLSTVAHTFDLSSWETEAGDYELDVSPYEDTVTSKPWKMNLSKLNMLKPDSDLCLKFAMLCTLNDKCDRLRKAYGEACSGLRCQRHLCLAQLRSFFEKAAESHAQGLLLCPCAPEDAGCGERRRNTIAPSCALPSVPPNCLDLRGFCRSDPLCRSRLMDFQTHCHPMDILGTCATEQSRCLRAYLGLIGTAMTPNFVSKVNTSVALACTCRGSGNLQDECEQLERSFSQNPCLMEAIAAKMRFHRQLFSQDWAASTFSVTPQQNNHPALRPQPRLPVLTFFVLSLILPQTLW